jgi:hypothetical protein
MWGALVLLLSLLICHLRCASSSAWSFSFSPLRTAKAPVDLYSLSPKQKIESVEHSADLTIGDVPVDVMRMVTARFASRSIAASHGKVRYHQRGSTAVAALPLPLFGYRNIPLRVRCSMPSEGDSSEGVEVTWSSGGSATAGLKVTCAVTRSGSKILVTTKTQVVGLSREELVKLSHVVEKALLSELERGISLATARSAQATVQQEIAMLANKVEKGKKLDKILHPEKYTSKAATVRRGSADGSSRYTPSDSVQARRQVKRG